MSVVSFYTKLSEKSRKSNLITWSWAYPPEAFGEPGRNLETWDVSSYNLMIFSFFYLIILFYLIIWDVSSYNLMISFILFICPADSSIGDLVTDSLSHQLLILEHTMVDLWPLKLLIRVMRKHDLSKKKYKDKEKDDEKDEYI